MGRTINNYLNLLSFAIPLFCFLALLISLFSAGNALAVDPDQYEPDNVFNAANVIVLNSGTPQQHNFHAAGDQDWVKFYGLSGEAYSMKASNLGTKCDAVLELYDTDGITRIADPTDDEGAGVDELLEWLCAKDGVYYVKVSQFDPSVFGDNTEYDLKIYNPVAPNIIGFLDGKVTDAGTKFPIVGALIKTNYGYSAISYSDGTYSMPHPAGSFTVTVQAAGYGATNFSVEISEGGTVLREIELTPLALVSPDIKANGQDGPITIPTTTPLAISVNLNPASYAGQDADWWVAESTPSGSFNYYDLGAGSMTPGLLPTYQGALFGLGSTSLPNPSNLTVGAHTFYFAVDLNMNGSLDMDSMYFDAVRVNVTQ